MYWIKPGLCCARIETFVIPHLCLQPAILLPHHIAHPPIVAGPDEEGGCSEQQSKAFIKRRGMAFFYLSLFLASQDAIEVMSVTEYLTHRSH